MVLAVEISFMALLHKNIFVKTWNSTVRGFWVLVFLNQTNSAVT